MSRRTQRATTLKLASQNILTFCKIAPKQRTTFLTPGVSAISGLTPCGSDNHIKIENSLFEAGYVICRAYRKNAILGRYIAPMAVSKVVKRDH